MVRTTLRWLVILVGVAGVVCAAAAWYAWVRSDEMVRDELQARLAAIAPACDLQLGRVRFDWNRSITVRDFAVRAKGKDSPPSLVVPEVEIRIDRDRFVNDQAIDVQLIRLVRPRFDLTRRVDGTWSIEDLAPFRLDPSIPVPEWLIEDATVRVCLEQEHSDPVVLTLQDAKLQLVPAGRRQLIIRGLSDVADAGPLQVSGKLNLEADNVTWSLSGSVSGLNTSGNIAGFALRSSSNLRDRVAQLGSKLRQAEQTLLATVDAAPSATPNSPFRPAGRNASTPAPWEDDTGPAARVDADTEANEASDDPGSTAEAAASEPCDLTGLGLNALVDLEFTVGKPDPKRPPAYQVWLDCRDGQVVNPLLPFPLQHLRGKLYWDNANLTLTEFRADGDGTALRVDGSLKVDGPEPGGKIEVSVTDLAVSDRYPGKLPPAVERFLQTVRPSGPVDAVGVFERDAGDAWKVRSFKLTAKGATAVPAPFPYPITDISGVLELTAPDRLEANMTGKAGLRPVSLSAHVLNPGPEAEVLVEITAPSVVVDAGVREAFKPEVRTVLDRLGLEGVAENLRVWLIRPPGFEQKYSWWLTTKVRDGEIEYEGFPYRIKQLSGDVDYQSDTETLTFANVKGVHDRAALSVAKGTYRKPPVTPASAMPGTPPFGLDLPIIAQRVALGSDLRAAVPPGLRSVWDDLQPGGLADLDVRIRWVPGVEPDIRLPAIRVTGGSLRLKAFPYPLDTITANLAYAPGKLDIADFVGWHPADGTRLEAQKGVFSLEPNDEWRLQLPEFAVTDLNLGDDFRRAAPPALRQAIEKIDLRGAQERSPVKDLRGRIDLLGSRRAPTVSAGWNLTAQLVDASARLGVDVSRAFGAVTCRGQVGGTQPDWFDGSLVSMSAEAFGQRFDKIQGPFAFRDGRIEVGTAAALAGGLDNPADPSGITTDRRLTAVCLGDGLLTFDALLALGERPRYDGRATLSGGRLEHLAQNTRAGGMRNVSGVMNGWVNFQGDGSDPSGLVGRGRLRIEPAALGQLPVMMQIFQALTTLVPAGNLDNSMFRYAEADFRIRDRGFETSLWPRPGIVLAGDALRLIGGGRVEFDGRLNLEFQTVLQQNPAKVVPIIGQLVSRIVETATTGWVSIVVTGTTDAPNVQQRPLKAPADGARQFFEALGPVPPRTAAGSRR